MQIEYEISEQDFIDAQQLAIKNSPVRLIRWTRLMMPLFGVAMLAFLVQGSIRQGISWRFAPGLFFCMFFVSIPLLNRRTQKKLYAKATAMHGRLSLGVDEDGLRFQGPAFSSQVGWPHFAKFFENEKSFVFYQNQQVFNLVPKRNLSTEEITTLRGYLERKIGRTS